MVTMDLSYSLSYKLFFLFFHRKFPTLFSFSTTSVAVYTAEQLKKLCSPSTFIPRGQGNAPNVSGLFPINPG